MLSLRNVGYESNGHEVFGNVTFAVNEGSNGENTFFI